MTSGIEQHPATLRRVLPSTKLGAEADSLLLRDVQIIDH